MILKQSRKKGTLLPHKTRFASSSVCIISSSQPQCSLLFAEARSCFMINFGALFQAGKAICTNNSTVSASPSLINFFPRVVVSLLLCAVAFSSRLVGTRLTFLCSCYFCQNAFFRILGMLFTLLRVL